MKRWLRGPDAQGEPVVELISGEDWYGRSGHGGRRQERRSLLAEMLSDDDIRRFRVADGVWYLPGYPP